MNENITLKELMLRMEKEINEKIIKLELDVGQIWAKIDKIQNRPPLWVTFLFMVMSAFMGYLVKGG